LIASVLDAERPDLVVFTGDVISGDEAPDPAAALGAAAAPVVERGLPWAYVLGNHDDEGRLDRSELMEVARAQPGCLIQRGPPDIGGVGNYVLPVAGTRGGQVAALLYFLDSGSYCLTGAGHYAWFTHRQVAWYRLTSQAWERRARAVLPAIAFFHIPIPEYDLAWREGYDKRGSRHEPVCGPSINAGMFAAFYERGDVAGTFVGHDHANDFDATLHGIRLCYGRASGYGGYGRLRFARGARVIELREGRREFRSWLRLATRRATFRRG
jgi:hypothetical protein